MARRKQNAKKATSKAQVSALVKSMKQLQVKPKKRPFRETGGIIGTRVGSMFGNASIGRGVGRWLGTGIGSIFGSGDYTLAGSHPSYNVMMNGAQIPKFDSTRQTNVVCHREYLGDIFGTAAFTNRQYALNPGMSDTFPWLSTVAANYQEYKFHGVVFEFRSLLTDFVTGGAPGVIVMSTNYNADAPVYTTKQQMENAEFAVSTKPTTSLMHGVECEDRQTILPQRYIRSSAPPSGQDLRLYDLGNFQLATSSNPVQDLGELWVSYCVEFFKPVQATVTSVPGVSEHLYRTGVTGSFPMGTNSVVSNGGLSTTCDGLAAVVLSATPGVVYKFDFVWSGASIVASFSSFAYSNVNTVGVNLYKGDTSNTVVSTNGLLVGTFFASILVKNSSSLDADIGVNILPGGVFPSTGLDIYISTLDPAIVA